MAKGTTPAASSPTATATPPSGVLNKTTSSTQNMKSQKSILGFFQKSSPSTPSAARRAEPASSPAERVSENRGQNGARKETPKSSSRTPKPKNPLKFKEDLAAVPSSDLVGPDEDEEEDTSVAEGRVRGYGCSSDRSKC